MNNLLALTTGAIIAIVVAVLVVAIALGVAVWWVSTRNALVTLRNKKEEGWATIDVSLKKRYDLIPNLVSTVKGYAAHESGTLEAVIKARNAAMTATGDARMQAENVLSGTLKSLFALQEAYPNLKADTQFLNLQRNLSSIEDELASARRYYNGIVKELNTKMDVFPSNLVAKGMHLEKGSYFELDSSEERQNVRVEF